MTFLRRLYRCVLRDLMASRVLPILVAQHPNATRGEIGRWAYDTADVVLIERDTPPATTTDAPDLRSALPDIEGDD